MATMGLPLRARAPLFATLALPLHGLRRWIAGAQSAGDHAGSSGMPLLHPTVELALPSTSGRHRSRILTGRQAASTPALRVLYQPQRGTGRLALAGRMADVCAELDRLALH